MESIVYGAIAIVIIAAAAGAVYLPGIFLNKGGRVVGNATVLNEVVRLTALAGKGNITVDNFNNIESMVQGDPKAEDSLNEAKVLTKYGEYVHVTHELNFLYYYCATGQEVSCPPHLLSHYYVFLKQNETALANDSFTNSKAQLPEWIPKARDYYTKYPSNQTFDQILSRINYDISQVDAGNSTTTDGEISFLSDQVVCVY